MRWCCEELREVCGVAGVASSMVDEVIGKIAAVGFFSEAGPCEVELFDPSSEKCFGVGPSGCVWVVCLWWCVPSLVPVELVLKDGGEMNQGQCVAWHSSPFVGDVVSVAHLVADEWRIVFECEVDERDEDFGILWDDVVVGVEEPLCGGCCLGEVEGEGDGFGQTFPVAAADVVGDDVRSSFVAGVVEMVGFSGGVCAGDFDEGVDGLGVPSFRCFGEVWAVPGRWDCDCDGGVGAECFRLVGCFREERVFRGRWFVAHELAFVRAVGAEVGVVEDRG